MSCVKAVSYTHLDVYKRQEQAKSLDQVRIGIEQISGVVQTNAAMVEENAATGGELAAEAKKLFDLISRFRTDRKM